MSMYVCIWKVEAHIVCRENMLVGGEGYRYIRRIYACMRRVKNVSGVCTPELWKRARWFYERSITLKKECF